LDLYIDLLYVECFLVYLTLHIILYYELLQQAEIAGAPQLLEEITSKKKVLGCNQEEEGYLP
jgi:hypothetical protein